MSYTIPPPLRSIQPLHVVTDITPHVDNHRLAAAKFDEQKRKRVDEIVAQHNKNRFGEGPTPPRRRRDDPDLLVEIELWIVPALSAFGFIVTLMVLLVMEGPANTPAVHTAKGLLAVFAITLDVSIMIPIAQALYRRSLNIFGYTRRA